jgi:hypothetical protein
MSPNSRYRLAWYFSVGVALALSACQSGVPAVATPVAVVPAATNTVIVQVPATQAPSATNTTNTTLPNTPTAAPTATGTAPPLPTATATAVASPRAVPTNTPLPTATANPPARPKPTSVPATEAPTAQPAPASIYSTTNGPGGYVTVVRCKRGSAPCTPVMAPGDINFDMGLGSDASAPWTNFVKYGLSVEKDGANAAELFMFVDAGWLEPGRIIGFGTSRNFNQPGAYVIRSSGCMTTDQTSNDCAWTTMAGDVVTFVIQP